MVKSPSSLPSTYASKLEDLRQVEHALSRLLSCATVGELFASAAQLVLDVSGLERAVVLTARGSKLSARESDALADAESDLLRRRVLSSPIDLPADTREGKLVLLGSEAGGLYGAPSVFDQVSGFGQVVVGPIAPEGVVLAFLVADRADRPVGDVDRGFVITVGIVLGVALERLALRARVAEVEAELRNLAVTSQALMSEVLRAPLTVPSDGAGTPVFHRWGDEIRPPRDPVRELLTEREIQVASLLCNGATNKEIARDLSLSPQTVKDYVAKLCRKLQASNRAGAASRYMRLLQEV